MYAAKLTEKLPWGGGTRISVLLFEKRSDRDHVVKFVNMDAHAKDYFTVSLYWDESTKCEPMGMREARKWIGDDAPIRESDGGVRCFDYTPFVQYEDVIHYMGGVWPNHTYRHRRWNGTDHYDYYEETTEYRKVG